MSYLAGGQAERTDAGGSHYVTDGLGVASETQAGATTYYTRTPSGHLISQRNANGVWYYYLFDGLGSVVGLVDTSGTLVARYGYDPYGQTVTKTGTAADGNPFRYTGAYLDRTGLYHLGARYYDPARGRFTQLDPLGHGYVYAGDNPVNFVDPSGLDNCDPGNTCQGSGNTVYGTGNMVIGDNNTVYGDNNTVYGNDNSVYGDDNRVLGDRNEVHGDHAGGGGPTETLPPYIYPPGANGVGLGEVCRAALRCLPPIRPPTLGDPGVLGPAAGDLLGNPRDWRAWIEIIIGGGINWGGM